MTHQRNYINVLLKSRKPTPIFTNTLAFTVSRLAWQIASVLGAKAEAMTARDCEPQSQLTARSAPSFTAIKSHRSQHESPTVGETSMTLNSFCMVLNISVAARPEVDHISSNQVAQQGKTEGRARQEDAEKKIA